MAERFGLVLTQGGELGVASVKPGGVSSQVAFLGAHLMDTACHELLYVHEGVWREAERIGVVTQKGEGTPLIHHECLCPSFQCTVGIGHDFVARQGGEVREESGVNERSKREVFEERNSEVCQCIH